MRLVLSRLIGTASGERRFLRSLCVAVAGICWIDGGRLDGELAPVAGWPDPRTALRRHGIEPCVLDRAWRLAQAEDGQAAVLPEWLIDLVVPWRLRSCVAEVSEMGASVAQDRLERFCRLETLRPARPYAGRVSTVSAGTIEALLTSARRLFTVFNDLALREIAMPMVEGWRLLPGHAAAADLGAVPAGLDRSAPPVRLVREVLARLDEQALEGDARVLRNRALVGLLACTGARPGAVSRLRTEDIVANHRFPDGSRGPAARLRPGKTIPLSQHRWKALPTESPPLGPRIYPGS